MAGTKEIKRRIKSVKNINKITKAMELVAAAKMKRSVASVLASRLYAEYSWEILSSIGRNVENIQHPLFSEREVKNVLLVLITSNRGLCGAYNAQVGKRAVAFLQNMEREYQGASFGILTVGKKGEMLLRRMGRKIVASFSNLPDNITLRDILPISQFIIEEYVKENYDRVVVAYTDFVSPLVQKPRVKQIAPVSRHELKELIETIGEAKDRIHLQNGEQNGNKKIDYLFEGDQNTLISSLAEKLLRMQVYQVLLESREWWQ
jgi:F-type H+-transporting ATPase subunit gamma